MANEFHAASDEELARQTQAGSHAAFEELVYRYEHRVFGFVAQFCGRGPEARDITQETFVKAFQAIAQFNPAHTFAAWLFTIARRKCIDHYRAAPPRTEESAPELLDPHNPAELLVADEDRRGLWQAARRVLSETQFQALWLKYVEDLSITQLALVLRKTQAHVKVILFRARLALGHELEKSRREALARLPGSGPRPEARLIGSQPPERSLDQLAAPTTPAAGFTPHLTCL